jgi:hypothetical protein
MPVLPDPISSSEPPRRVFATYFKSPGSELPIHGGWGYTMDDAVVIDREDPIVPKGSRFDGVEVEYAFVEKRIYAEMIFLRPPGEAFAGIEWKLLRQSLMSPGVRYYDLLEFEITAFSERDWSMFKSGGFDAQEYNRRREQMLIRFTREFWFDITSFYGHA